MSARILSGEMKPSHAFTPTSSGLLTRTLLCAGLLILLTACTPQATPTLFIPPTARVSMPTGLPAGSPAAAAASATPRPTSTAVAPSSTPCTNDLRFVQDVTIPDGTSVLPGELVDKQWLVTNTGSCDWDARYRLRLLTGDSMNAAVEQALYPARAGTQATLRIVFTAPQDPGNHQGAWQAVAPDGQPFGEAVYVQVNVAP
jgi:hypothetical protein